MSALRGRVAVVTGGTSGIGLASAAALARAGAHVTIAGRNQERGREAEQALRAESLDVAFIACDVHSSGSVAALIDEAVRRHGGLDVMVNCAGIEGPIAPLHDYPDEALHDVLATNFAGVALGMKWALPALLARGGGTIINVASTIGTLLPFPGGVVYGGTKAAVMSMTAAAAAGYADQGIRVFALQPWITDTPMIDRLSGGSPEAKAGLAALNPGGRIVEPGEVAAVVVGIASGALPHASGSALVIDSGRVAGAESSVVGPRVAPEMMRG
jgi:NAD(P)-dependent dehydrogenase (short-subunit alcohol dehydrogenase family)